MNTLAELNNALVGRYVVEREIGQGGMATVYLARDVRHDRKVAIKVLHPELAAVLGPERFVTEMKVTANLQHPHILPLFDSGNARLSHPEPSASQGSALEGPRSSLYYVMPFVDGESLRERLQREQQLPIGEAILITTEVASALDYAHRHGVVHRDIKPENILLHDGTALVADFGIALAVSNAGGTRLTQTGLSLGTPQYMSPEQATGDKKVDGRTDIYSLGCVLYEMLTGEPPFTGPNSQAIVARVLTEHARPIRAVRDTVSQQLEDAALTALQKLPADRFATAGAFATALEQPHLGETALRTPDLAPRAIGYWLRIPWSWGGLAVAAAAFAFAGIVVHRAGQRQHVATFTQETYRTEAIYSARFAPDGKTIVFSSVGDTGTTPHLFIIRPEYPEAVPFGPDSTHLLAISAAGELAVLTGAQYIGHRLFIGTLATLPLGGGAPREILAGVREADWAPDGKSLAVTRSVSDVDRLEYPIGAVVARSVGGYFSDLRISPQGNRIACFEHPARGDDRGSVLIIDRRGHVIARSAPYNALEGLAWRRDGRAVFFSGGPDKGGYSAFVIHAMDRTGHALVTLSSAGGATMQDVSTGGQWLVTHDANPDRVMIRSPGASTEREIGWLDLSSQPALSPNGKLLAFDDEETGGVNYRVLLRKTEGSPAASLGEGMPLAFSSDGVRILAIVYSTPPKVMLYPTGPGEPQRLDHGEFESLLPDGALFADGQRFFACGNLHGQRSRCYIGAIAGGPLTAVTPEGTTSAMLSPDDTQVAARVGGAVRIFSLVGGPARAAVGVAEADSLIRWSPDGHELWVYRGSPSAIRVESVNPQDGRRTPLVDITPHDRAGVRRVNTVVLADDPHVYAYVQYLYTSHLFLVDGAQ
jgi:hypothetical protein